MDLDSCWYAYQCKAGEVLFYYNTVSGEHKWAIHFCSCLKPKTSNSQPEPCCTWEPVKTTSSNSGKFVRSIGTETEDQYFTNSLDTHQYTPTTNTTQRTEISVEYSVSEGMTNDGDRTETSSAYSLPDEPVEVVLSDPFLDEDEKQSVSSKCLTLKLTDMSRHDLSFLDNRDTALNKTDTGSYIKVVRSDHSHIKNQSIQNDLKGFKHKSLTDMSRHELSFSDSHDLALNKTDTGFPLKSARNEHQSNQNALKGKHKGLGNTNRQSQHDPGGQKEGSSVPSLCADSDLIQEINISEDSIRKRKASTSSRKNPEPKKLLKRTESNINPAGEENEEDDPNNRDYWIQDVREKLFDDSEEVESTNSVVVVKPDLSSIFYDEEDSQENADELFTTVCELCNKDCGTASALTNHLMQHQPSGTKCPICNKHFSRRQGLRYHVQTHSGDKPHTCDLCKKTFTKSASLVTHIRAHSGVKPFVCPKCGKGFTHSSNLSSHIRSHSSLRPYCCKFCDKGFKTSSHLTLHLRCHSNERPYKCVDCVKAFKSSSHLKSHKRLHKQVVCRGCNRTFKSSSLLAYHHSVYTECLQAGAIYSEEKHEVLTKDMSTECSTSQTFLESSDTTTGSPTGITFLEN